MESSMITEVSTSSTSQWRPAALAQTFQRTSRERAYCRVTKRAASTRRSSGDGFGFDQQATSNARESIGRRRVIGSSSLREGPPPKRAAGRSNQSGLTLRRRTEEHV